MRASGPTLKIAERLAVFPHPGGIGIYVSPGFVYRILAQGIARLRPEEAPL